MDVSDAESEYKAATLTLQRRYADNYSLYGAVTWSEDRDNDSNERNFAGIQLEDLQQPRLNWGPSNRDQEWKVVLNGVWDTPIWGIGLAGAFRFATGSPFTPRANIDLNDDGESGTDRPTVNGVHLGRNSERLPDFCTFDMRLSKKFGIGPGDLAVFAECFNCTDREHAVHQRQQPDHRLADRSAISAHDVRRRGRLHPQPAHDSARAALRLLGRSQILEMKGGGNAPFFLWPRQLRYAGVNAHRLT